MDNITQSEVELTQAFKANVRYATLEGEEFGVYYSAQSKPVVFAVASTEPPTPEQTALIIKKLDRRLKFEAKKK